MTFTNLFAWSNTHPVFLSKVKNTLLFWRGPAEKGVLLMPIGDLDKSGIETAFKWARNMGGPSEFGRLSFEAAIMLVTADPGLAMIEDRDNADYVYKAFDLSGLEGRKYDGKRNLIKKFASEVSAVYKLITLEMIPACLAMQDCWCEVRECSIHADLDAEDQAVKRIFEHWESLNVIGGALLAEEKIIAFSVAEQLAPSVAVVHLEKADSKYPGVYQAINQQFATHALADFEFVNREQDLGVEGLRKAKLSYHPDHLVLKYTVKRQE